MADFSRRDEISVKTALTSFDLFDFRGSLSGPSQGNVFFHASFMFEKVGFCQRKIILLTFKCDLVFEETSWSDKCERTDNCSWMRETKRFKRKLIKM